VSEHYFTFGGVPCLIISQAQPAMQGFAYVATMFVMKDEGRTLQPIGDRHGDIVELPATQDVDAVGRAVNYLTKRFGAQTPGPVWNPPLGRFVESEGLIDERPE
jgi:hypothetical protein